MDVGVVGGGITGLAAAIAFVRLGHQVTVFERAPEFAEVGAGIALPPNALRCLGILGLRDRFQAHSRSTAAISIQTETGRILVRGTLAQFSGGSQFVVTHRAALIAALVGQLPERCLRPAHAVSSVTPDGSITTQHGAQSFDLVVGADGVNSTVRRSLWRTKQPGHTGVTAWRWILDRPPEDIGFYWGRHAEFGIVPLDDDKTYAYGGARRGHADLDSYRNWPAPLADAIVRRDRRRVITDELVELRPPRRLTVGSVVLLGDAAHALRPTFGQGAALGLEDAVTLAHSGRTAYLKRRRRMLLMYLASRYGDRFATPASRLLTHARNTALRTVPDRAFTALAGSPGRWSPPRGWPLG